MFALIPAHDEEFTIESIVNSVAPLVDWVFVVDDGSSDSTASKAAAAGAEVIVHNENLGIGFALQTGYNKAIALGAEFLVQLDADGQHNPEDSSVLLQALDHSTDIVIGSRFKGEKGADGYSLVRTLGIRFFSFITSVLGGSRLYDVTSGYRVYRVAALSRIPTLRTRHWAVEQTLMALRLDLVIKEVPIVIPPRRIGASQFKPQTAILYPIRMLQGIIRALRLT